MVFFVLLIPGRLIKAALESWARVSPRIKGILLMIAATLPAGSAAGVRAQWEHPQFLSVWMWVPMLLFPASLLLLYAGIQYFRGNREKVLSTPVALPGSDGSGLATVRDVGRWLSLGTVALLAARVGTAWTFWWGATEKHPWNGYNWLAHWLFDVEAMYTPYPWYRDFLLNVAKPNFGVYAPTTFAVELLLGITLFLGIGARLAGLIGCGWGALIYFGNWNVPGEPFWILALIFLAPLGVAGARGGRALGVDMLLQPKLAGSSFRVMRWVSRWAM
jgi:hypothetical protein